MGRCPNCKQFGTVEAIVEEVRKARDVYAKRFNYDLDAIYQDLKEKEHRSGHVVVPRGDTVLQAGDEVLALVTADSEEPVKRILVGA